MKILLVCNFAWGTGDFRYGLYNTLKRMKGVRVRQVFLRDSFEKAYKSFDPDIIISIKKIFTDLEMKMIKGSCLKIQLFPDDPDLYEKFKPYFNQFDYWFTNSEYALKNFYQRDNVENAYLCGFACDPELYKVVSQKDEYKCDIMFAGGISQKHYRLDFLKSLEGLDLKVWGRFNSEFYGYQGYHIQNEEYISALKSCKIAIDFNVSGSGFLNVKSKSFEITCAGAMMVSNQFDEMENYFKYGKEVVGFQGLNDFRSVIEHYLENEDERKTIAEAGYKSFMQNHTWEKRLKEVFKTCNVEI